MFLFQLLPTLFVASSFGPVIGVVVTRMVRSRFYADLSLGKGRPVPAVVAAIPWRRLQKIAVGGLDTSSQKIHGLARVAVELHVS